MYGEGSGLVDAPDAASPTPPPPKLPLCYGCMGERECNHWRGYHAAAEEVQVNSNDCIFAHHTNMYLCVAALRGFGKVWEGFTGPGMRDASQSVSVQRGQHVCCCPAGRHVVGGTQWPKGCGMHRKLAVGRTLKPRDGCGRAQPCASLFCLGSQTQRASRSLHVAGHRRGEGGEYVCLRREGIGVCWARQSLSKVMTLHLSGRCCLD